MKGLEETMVILDSTKEHRKKMFLSIKVMKNQDVILSTPDSTTELRNFIND